VILQLEFPFVASPVERAEVSRWWVDEGAIVRLGDDLCDLVATSHLRRVRADAPNRRMSRRAAAEAPRPNRHQVGMLIRITAAEEAVVRTVLARAGAEVAVGDPLALLSTDASEPLDGGGEPLRLRAVANPVEE
jgi:pyruvate/2-oxoglutarate dehydrogenase complex dihydrolipoamide acyltransferase (E2) component